MFDVGFPGARLYKSDTNHPWRSCLTRESNVNHIVKCRFTQGPDPGHKTCPVVALQHWIRCKYVSGGGSTKRRVTIQLQVTFPSV